MKDSLFKTEQNIRELTVEDMVKGIGRKATNWELMVYLSKDSGKPVSLEDAFAKYSKQN